MIIVDGDGDGDGIHGSLGSIGVCQDNVRSLPVPHRSKLQILWVWQFINGIVFAIVIVGFVIAMQCIVIVIAC